MKRTTVIVIAVVAAGALAACGGKKDEEVSPKPQEPQPPPADPKCDEKIGPFADWMKGLVADGRVTVITTGIELAPIGVGPTQVTREAPIVKVTPAEVSFQGGPVASLPTAKGVELQTPLEERLKPTPGTDVVFVIDRKVPWESVATLLEAARHADHPRVTLVFAAQQPGAAAAPPPSSIDAEIDAIVHRDPSTANTAGLAQPIGTKAGIVDKVFADCAAVTQKLLPAIDKVDPRELDVAVAVGMPAEIKTCGCRVEMAAVQRLMWAWWGRDQGPALGAVKIEITAPANGVDQITSAPTTAWADVAQLVVAAAAVGKPVSVK